MKSKKNQISVWLSITATLLFVLASLTMMGGGCDEGPPCCPEIVEFEAPWQYICPQCPDSAIKLTYKIVYVQYKSGHPCKGNINWLEFKNITPSSDPSELEFPTPTFIETSTGVFENPSGGLLVKVHPDSSGQYKDEYTIQLIAKGSHKDCPSAVREVKVKTVKEGTYHVLCFNYKRDTGFWQGTTNIFGPCVFIKSVTNPSPQPNSGTVSVEINITHGGETAAGVPAGEKTIVFDGDVPNGLWQLEIPDENEKEPYIEAGYPLCITVYLTCVCE